MKKVISTFAAVGAMALLPSLALAADSGAELKTQKEKVSYGVGMNIGTSLKRSGFEVDVDLLAAAIKDVLGSRAQRSSGVQVPYSSQVARPMRPSSRSTSTAAST